MSENNTEANRPAIVINNQYIKDLSLEIPHAPEIFGKLNQQPELKVDIDVQTKNLDNGVFNVSLNVAMNGKIGEESLFILELSYGAVVTLNVPAEHVQPVLAIEIPRLMFPFVRNIVSQCLIEGGLPPIMLNPIDFAAVYAARQAAPANQNQ